MSNDKSEESKQHSLKFHLYDFFKNNWRSIITMIAHSEAMSELQPLLLSSLKDLDSLCASSQVTQRIILTALQLAKIVLQIHFIMTELYLEIDMEAK